MFKTVLVIYCLTEYVNSGTVHSQVLSTIPADKSQPREAASNTSNIVTAILINVNTRGAPRALNLTKLRYLEPLPKKINVPSRSSGIVTNFKKTPNHLGENSHLVNPSTTSNPKNDVEVFAPLEGTPPLGYGPHAPQPPSFPPSLPDFPAGVYPYEPPYYYPVYSNDIPSYQPYYPAILPVNPVYPQHPQQPPVTRSNRNYPESTTSRPHETEPTTAPTPVPHGRSPAKEPEPEIIVPSSKKPKTSQPKATSPRTPKGSPDVNWSYTREPWTRFHAKSYTTPPSVPKVTNKRQTLTYATVTQPYPYDAYYTTVPPVYNVLNYSPTTANPRAVFFSWTTKRAPAPPAIYPYLTKTTTGTAPDYSAVPGYQFYPESVAIQIGGRAGNKVAEKLKNVPWSPPTRTVQVIGTPAALDPKFKLAIVSNYENFNETAGTFGFDIDLENGLTVQIRGYKKNGKQVLDGSFSLFTNDGQPVKITYTADDENEKRSTSKSNVPKNGDENSTTNTAKDEVTAAEFFDN